MRHLKNKKYKQQSKHKNSRYHKHKTQIKILPIWENLINKVAQLHKIHRSKQNKQNSFYNKNSFKLKDISVKIIFKRSKQLLNNNNHNSKFKMIKKIN
jgi:arginine utilization protein RocB